MRVVLVLLIVGFTAVLAQVDNFAANDSDLENLSVEDDFEGLLGDDEINENDEEAISQAALSIIRTGRPICLNRNNWGRRFRHNWHITKYWECKRWRTDLRACTVPRIYQPSLERCVWPWNWRWEPIRRPPPSPETTVTWTDPTITNTTPILCDTSPQTTPTTPNPSNTPIDTTTLNWDTTTTTTNLPPLYKR